MGTGATSGAVFRSIVLAASAVTSHRVAAALAIAAIAVDTAIKAALATATMHSHPLNRLLSAICVSFARIVFPRRIEPAHGICRVLAPALGAQRHHNAIRTEESIKRRHPPALCDPAR